MCRLPGRAGYDSGTGDPGMRSFASAIPMWSWGGGLAGGGGGGGEFGAKAVTVVIGPQVFSAKLAKHFPNPFINSPASQSQPTHRAQQSRLSTLYLPPPVPIPLETETGLCYDG